MKFALLLSVIALDSLTSAAMCVDRVSSIENRRIKVNLDH